MRLDMDAQATVQETCECMAGYLGHDMGRQSDIR